MIFNYEELKSNELAILDARGKQNFDAGHIPGSTCMPFNLLFNQDRTFKKAEEIVGLFTSVGDLEDPRD